jgi:toxin ParE1/3/4
MIEILLRPTAQADIEAIADYTIERWGRRQAEAYVMTLRADIVSLAQFPKRFPIHEPSGLALRRMRSGHHLIFYRESNAAVEIVRVLHERSDPSLDIP